MAAESERNWVPLQGANLCLDCEAIFHGPVCPSCASRNGMPVQRWVDPADGQQAQPNPQPPPVPPERWRQVAYVLLGLAAGVLIGKNKSG